MAGNERSSSSGMKILVVEDDQPVREFLREDLERLEYSVTSAADGEEAESLLEDASYDLLVLDLNIPKRDEFEVLKSLQRYGQRPPVLILTERSRVEDRIRGLDSGADDYMPKPFSLAELTARIRAIARRARPGSNPIVRVGDLEIDRMARTARRQNRTINLTPREFALLEYLATDSGECVTCAMIIENVWKFVPDTMTNVVDIPIRMARFASNWELSTSRATEIARLFITEYQISPERFAIAGYAEYRPTAPNDTAEGRAMNRRVDIVILPDAVPVEEAGALAQLSKWGTLTGALN